MHRFIVITCRIPTNYNLDVCYVVEAATGEDAIKIVRDNQRDFGSMAAYTYSVKPYDPPPAGRIVSTYTT